MKRVSVSLLLLWLSLVGISIEGRSTDKKQAKRQTKQSINMPIKQEESEKLYLIDDIRATVYGEESTDIITKSELERPGIDGVYRSLHDHIIERLLYQEAVKYKMLPTAEAVEKHLQAVQQDHNLTLEELNAIFKTAGYTPEEGKEQFAHLSAISSIIDFKIRSRLIVLERDIIAYYEENPVWEQPAYLVQRAVVRIPRKKEPEKFKKELEYYIKTGIGSFNISWADPFWIKQDEMAEEWRFIMDMNCDEIRIVQELPEEIELLKLVEKREKRLKPLEERYREIAELLRRPKYEELFMNYRQSLFDSASIIYFEE